MKKKELIKIFSRFDVIRSINNEGVTYWFAEDIKEIFNIKNILELEEKLNYFDMISVFINENDTKKTLLVNEYGLYNLFLCSSIPEAKEFKNWLINDVIPSIRTEGEYTLKGERELKIQINVKDEARTILSHLLSNFRISLDIYKRNFNNFGKDISLELETKTEKKWKVTSQSFNEMCDNLLELVNFFLQNQKTNKY